MQPKSCQNPYQRRYEMEGWYWGRRPSSLCFKVLELLPPERPLRLLDIGCGEGRNAVFFARNGYHVTAFDFAESGVEKTKRMAREAGVDVEVFQADLNRFRLNHEYDILFSSGVLHYIPPELRAVIFANYREYTAPNGINAFTVFVHKPFIPPAPDAEPTAHTWLSGEIFTLYHDWRLEYCTETIFDCNSSGTPHKHASNRIVARKPKDNHG